MFFGLVKMTIEQEHASYSLPEEQAVEVTFLAPCRHNIFMWVITETVTLGNPSLGLVHLVDQDDASELNAAFSPAEWYRVNINDLINTGGDFNFGVQEGALNE